MQSQIRYEMNINNFNGIPGNPIAYWVNDKMLNIFKKPSFYDMSISDGKNVTGNNDKFLRYLWEVNSNEIGIDKHYLKYLKGGTVRKWYGNIDYVIDWSLEARTFYRKDKVSRIIPEYLWYKPGISWTLISSNIPSFRIKTTDSTFDGGGLTIFLKQEKNLNYYMGMFNSKVFIEIQKILNPTLNLLIKDIRAIPMIIDKGKMSVVSNIVNCNIEVSKKEWDDFETSFDFKKHPLI